MSRLRAVCGKGGRKCVSVCVCVCDKERERERERDTKREGERQEDRASVRAQKMLKGQLPRVIYHQVY